jgi:hypothetical protein
MSSFVHSGAVSVFLKRKTGCDGGTWNEQRASGTGRTQTAYKAASWISIRNEEALVSANHSMAEVDRCRQAHLTKTSCAIMKAAKAQYEDALRANSSAFSLIRGLFRWPGRVRLRAVLYQGLAGDTLLLQTCPSADPLEWRAPG